MPISSTLPSMQQVASTLEIGKVKQWRQRINSNKVEITVYPNSTRINQQAMDINLLQLEQQHEEARAERARQLDKTS